MSQLRRIWRSIPLPNLKQGSKLSIRSQLPPHIKLTLQVIPQWRDDGHLTFQQIFPRSHDIVQKNEHEATMWVQSKASGHRDDVDVTIGLNDVSKQYAGGENESMQGRVGFSNRNYTEGETDRPDLYAAGRTNKDAAATEEGGNSNNGDDEPGIILIAKVPEKLHLSAKVGFGDIIIKNKLEGDSNLHTANGDVRCNKLRGEKIDINVGSGGLVHASSLIEAETLNINLAYPGRLRAKKISVKDSCVEVRKSITLDNARVVDNGVRKLDVDDALAIVDVSSLYCTGDDSFFSIANDEAMDRWTTRARIKYNHGHVSVRAYASTNNSTAADNEGNAIDEYGQLKAFVELGGVNGSCDVVIHSEESAAVCNEEAFSGGMAMLASKVHVDSLAPNSISMVKAHSGDVALSLDRKQELDLRLLSGKQLGLFDADILLEDCEDTISSTVSNLDFQISQTTKSNFERNTVKRISVATNAFEQKDTTGDLSSLKHVEYVQGVVKNMSNEKDSRFDVKLRGAQGKVDISGAAAQALNSFKGGSLSTVNQRPLFAVYTSERILVDTLSWIGAIARRYGMKDNMKKADAPQP